MTAIFQGVTARVEMNRCIRQGSKEAPALFQALMRCMLGPLEQVWLETSLGWRMDDFQVAVVFWADNVWLFGSSEHGLAKMIGILVKTMEWWGLKPKASSLEYLTTAPGGHPEQWAVGEPNGDAMLAFHRVHTMAVLGGLVSDTGKDLEAVEARLAAGSRAFWADSAALRNTQAGTKARLDRWRARVVGVGLYLGGTWTLTRGVARRLKVWESWTLRRLYAMRRRPGETFVDFMTRTTRFARRDANHKGIPSVVQMAVRRLWTLLVKLWHPTNRRLSPTHQKLRHLLTTRDTIWWRTMQYLGQADKDGNRQRWRHGKEWGRQELQWDGVVVRVFGEGWRDDPRVWDWQAFARAVVGHLCPGAGAPEDGRGGRAGEGPPKKAARLLGPPEWATPDDVEGRKTARSVQVALHGDNEMVGAWLNGLARCYDARFVGALDEMVAALGGVWHAGLAHPVPLYGDWFRHVYREHNIEADMMAARGSVGIRSAWWNPMVGEHWTLRGIRGHADGSGGVDGGLRGWLRLGGVWLLWQRWCVDRQMDKSGTSVPAIAPQPGQRIVRCGVLGDAAIGAMGGEVAEAGAAGAGHGGCASRKSEATTRGRGRIRCTSVI